MASGLDSRSAGDVGVGDDANHSDAAGVVLEAKVGDFLADCSAGVSPP